MAKAILLADITGPMGPVGDWYKGVIPNGSNLNDYTGTGKTGLYAVLSQPAAATMSNIPEDYAGSLLVLPVGAGASQEYTPYYWPARKWIRNSAPSTGTGWTAWRSVRGDAYVKHDQIVAGTDLNDIYGEGMEGSHASWITSITATLKNLPPALEKDPRSFILFAKTVGNGTVQEIDTYYWPARKYVRNSAPSTGTGWTAWKQVLMEGDLAEVSGGGSSSSTGFKTLPLILTAGRGGNENKAPLSATVEYDVNLAPSIHVSRYRFAIRDGNPRWGTSTAQVIALSNISVGGVVKLPGMTTSSDGSITFSPWMAGNFGNLKFDYVAQQQPRYIVGGGRVNGVRRVEMPFELWLEVEVPASTPAIGLVGDSNSVAVNATIPVNDSWMAQYCRDNGFFPVLYGHSGDAMSASGDPEHYKWNRWNHLDRPDVVVHANGANDLPTTEGGITLAELQARARAEWAVAAEKISKNQHVALIKSRASGVNNSVRLGLNAWYKTFPDPIREWHDIASPVTANDTGGLLPQYISSDGIHMTTAGQTAIKNALHKVMTISTAPIQIDTDGVPYF